MRMNGHIAWVMITIVISTIAISCRYDKPEDEVLINRSRPLFILGN